MMSTTARKSATTPLPVQLSAPEFETFILPHLSMPKCGPKCKLGYYRVFHLILWVLYTGMEWKCLPVPTDAQGKRAIQALQEQTPSCRARHDGTWTKPLLRQLLTCPVHPLSLLPCPQSLDSVCQRGWDLPGPHGLGRSRRPL